MPRLILQPHLTAEEVKQRMVAQKQLRLHTYWQVIHALATDPNKKSHQIAQVLGLSAANVTRIIKLYNTKGADFDQGLQWGGRRLANSFMSLEDEAAMMKHLQAKALKGAVLTFHDIKQAVEKKLSGTVSDDYIWDLFKRHGWSKKAPRPKHPNQDREAQEQFKKNFPSSWQPASGG